MNGELDRQARLNPDKAWTSYGNVTHSMAALIHAQSFMTKQTDDAVVETRCSHTPGSVQLFRCHRVNRIEVTPMRGDKQ